MAAVRRTARRDRSNRTVMLPDRVVQRILWFLPTKDAARASTVSKRWRSLWRSAPKLKFEDCYRATESQPSTFVNFVLKSLPRRGAPCVNVLSLTSHYTDKDTEAMVDAALGNNVQELHVCFGYLSRQPGQMFRARNLRKLRIAGSGWLEINDGVYLPNLKDLTLEGFCLPRYESEELFSSPSLERLRIRWCSSIRSLPKKQPIAVSAPKLHTFKIRNTGRKSPFLDITTPSLKRICLRYVLAKGVILSGSPLLDEAVLRIDNITVSWDGVSRNLSELVQHVSFVKNLKISFEFLQRLDVFDPVPVFSNLRNLKIIYCDHVHEQLLDPKPQLMYSLLRRCPSIETLVYDEGMPYFKVPRSRDDDQPPSPALFLSNLKKITVIHFSGSDTDLHNLTFLLRSAPVLEEVILRCYRVKDDDLKRLEEHHLSTLPRISDSCRFRIVLP